jgi:hypothetical protein
MDLDDTLNLLRRYDYYTGLMPSNAKLYCNDRPPPEPWLDFDRYYYVDYQQMQNGSYRASYGLVTKDAYDMENEEMEERSWESFDDFKEIIAPIARLCGPRILNCLCPIARNDPRIRNAALYWWKMVREYLVKRRIGFYWHEQTKHLMAEGGDARKRDRQAFEADRDDYVELAKKRRTLSSDENGEPTIVCACRLTISTASTSSGVGVSCRLVVYGRALVLGSSFKGGM